MLIDLMVRYGNGVRIARDFFCHAWLPAPGFNCSV
jgi:hypothetical protein